MIPLLIDGMHGLGDCINQRPYVLAAAKDRDVYLRTPWPELLAGSAVRCIPKASPLRMQKRNEKRSDLWWRDEVPDGLGVRLGYNPEAGNIHEQFERQLPLGDEPWRYELPLFDKPKQAPTRPYAIVRPVTLRHEWMAPSRNPEPGYVAEAAAMLRDRGLAVVVVAALSGNDEWLVGDLPPHDVDLSRGELSTTELLGLIRGASLCVGGEGFLLPAAMASSTPLCVIGSAHSRSATWMPARLRLARVEWVFTNSRCRCWNRGHVSDNTITSFDQRFAAALQCLSIQ